MDIDKEIIVNIILVIHMALTGLALLKLFRLKHATGGLVILSLLSLVVPILGPSGLIVYLNMRYKKQQKEEKRSINKTSATKSKSKNKR